MGEEGPCLDTLELVLCIGPVLGLLCFVESQHHVVRREMTIKSSVHKSSVHKQRLTAALR